MSHKTCFLLNDQEMCVDAPPGLLVLDYLRRNAGLTGTKEGCKEGDCGACAVLVGELSDGTLRYRPVTSCLMPLGEAHGKHLVTIEGLNMDTLTPVQQAIVDEGATQCGFCTPGIVVSLTGYLMEDGGEPNRAGIKKALGGHLCRCTGYRSLKDVSKHLQDIPDLQRGVGPLLEKHMLPPYFADIPRRLKALAAGMPVYSGNGAAPPAGRRIAGGTDIYVQEGEDIPEGGVDLLNLHPGMKGITAEEGWLRVGALTTFEAFAEHPLISAMMPEIDAWMFLIASWQIRNRATLGGNIINASPIADMTILLLALDCQLELQDGPAQRRVPLRDFYRGYKQLDKSPPEILSTILIPRCSAGTRINFEKVSKRTCLDIATVNSAIAISCDEGVIREVAIAVGGVAPVPLYLKETCRYLAGKSLSVSTVRAAFDVAQKEIAPISDIRGSAAYKRLLTRQLLMAHFCKIFADQMNAEVFYG